MLSDSIYFCEDLSDSLTSLSMATPIAQTEGMIIELLRYKLKADIIMYYAYSSP